jgi:hypothetical protein
VIAGKLVDKERPGRNCTFGRAGSPAALSGTARFARPARSQAFGRKRLTASRAEAWGTLSVPVRPAGARNKEVKVLWGPHNGGNPTPKRQGRLREERSGGSLR